MAVTIVSTHYGYPLGDGQAELDCVARLSNKLVYRQTVTHLSTELAQCRVTSLMRPTMFPLG